jgi:arylsulfatase A
MKRRQFLQSALGLAGLSTAQSLRQPNIVLILADDLGYGDIAPYGSKINTPNLTRMAKEGVMLRQYYAASAICSASRAALLTGRYGVRCGIPGALQPGDRYGLAEGETTIADLLKQVGYRTMCVGKWHLGTMPQFMPTARGFDDYYGLLHSNDQYPRALIRGTSAVESPTDLRMLTNRYTQKAVDFIESAKDGPFFLYMPHTFPHIPLAASPEFRGKSPLGLYGDAVMELDWSVGQILETLARLNLDDNTLVIFTSDNGPWFQGSPGPLRGRKAETFEGGMRVPFIARYPNRIPAKRRPKAYATALDLLPTLSRLGGAGFPGAPLDGTDIWPLLSGESPMKSSDHPLFLYFQEWNLQCARLGRWKLHVSRNNTPPWTPPPPEGRMNLPLLNPELYDMDADPEESYSQTSENPAVVAEIQARIQNALLTMPVQVRNAWNDTVRRQANPNGDGEWPTLRTP